MFFGWFFSLPSCVCRMKAKKKWRNQRLFRFTKTFRIRYFKAYLEENTINVFFLSFFFCLALALKWFKSLSIVISSLLPSTKPDFRIFNVRRFFNRKSFDFYTINAGIAHGNPCVKLNLSVVTIVIISRFCRFFSNELGNTYTKSYPYNVRIRFHTIANRFA